MRIQSLMLWTKPTTNFRAADIKHSHIWPIGPRDQIAAGCTSPTELRGDAGLFTFSLIWPGNLLQSVEHEKFLYCLVACGLVAQLVEYEQFPRGLVVQRSVENEQLLFGLVAPSVLRVISLPSQEQQSKNIVAQSVFLAWPHTPVDRTRPAPVWPDLLPNVCWDRL